MAEPKWRVFSQCSENSADTTERPCPRSMGHTLGVKSSPGPEGKTEIDMQRNNMVCWSFSYLLENSLNLL